MDLPDRDAPAVAHLWGATLQDLAPSVAESLGVAGIVGVVVSDVDGTAADGLRRGDVIVGVDDVPVRTVAELRALASSEAEVRRVEVRRDGARVLVRVDAALGGRPRG